MAAPPSLSISTPPAAPLHHPPKRAWLRFVAFALVVVLGFSLVFFTPLRQYLDRQRLIEALTALRGAWWSPLALLGLHLVLAPLGLPMSPVVLAGGAVFGMWYGGLLNLIGLFLGATASYLLARSLGRELIIHLAGKRLKRLERQLHKNGFWALVALRIVPLPFPVANFGMALAGVRPGRFFLTTLVGMTPTTFLYSYSAAMLMQAAAGGAGAGRKITLAVLSLAVLAAVPAILSRSERRRRYERLLAARRARVRSR